MQHGNLTGRRRLCKAEVLTEVRWHQHQPRQHTVRQQACVGCGLAQPAQVVVGPQVRGDHQKRFVAKLSQGRANTATGLEQLRLMCVTHVEPPTRTITDLLENHIAEVMQVDHHMGDPRRRKQAQMAFQECFVADPQQRLWH